MSDEHSLTLRQADQARADFYAIESELEIIQAQLARLPTRKKIGVMALLAMTGAVALATVLALMFLR